MRKKRFVKKVVFWVLAIILIIGNLPVVDTQAEVYDEIQVNSDSMDITDGMATDGEIFGQRSAVEDEEQNDPEGEGDKGSSSGTGVEEPDSGENTITFRSSNGILTKENVIEQIEDEGYEQVDTFAAIIDDSVRVIDRYAFYKRAGLVSVIFSNSVESIGFWAFYNCISLTKVEIPQSVVFIGFGAFLECSNLSEVYFDGNAPRVETFAFSSLASEAKAYVYPSSEGFPAEWKRWNELDVLYREAPNEKIIICSTENANGTLSQVEVNQKLETIPDGDEYKIKAVFDTSVKAIGCAAFYGSLQLASIEIPITVLSIESRAFGDCKNLVKAFFDAGEPDVASDAFEELSDKAVVYVYPYARGFPAQGQLWNGFIVRYRDNSDDRTFTFNTIEGGTLTSEDVKKQLDLTEFDYYNGFIAKFSENVTAIGFQAFVGCTSLVSVLIPDNVTRIDDMAFSGCVSLMEICVSAGNGKFSSSSDGVLFNKNKDTLLCFPAGKSGSYTIPNSVITIGNYAFDRCSYLARVVIPTSVNEIVSYAFSNCANLFEVYFDGDAPIVRSSAFSQLPKGALAYVYRSAEDFENEGMSWNNLIIRYRDDMLITFTTSSSDGTLTYSEVREQITDDSFIAEFDSSIKAIGNLAFDRCSNLMSALISNNVHSIEDQAFNNCINLTDVMITDSVVSIGDWVFDGCTSLKEINVSQANVAYSSSVEGVLFDKDTTRLVVFPAGKSGIYVIPYGVTIIGDSAFYKCVGLTNVIIPNSVKTIADYAFNYCSSLTSITIPSNVESIGNFAFAYCTNLTKIIGDLPDDDYIGAWAFDEIPYNGDVPTPTIIFDVDGTLTQKDVSDQIPEEIVQDDRLFIATFSETVTAIDARAFYDYPNLTSVVIGKHVKSIGKEAFAYCVGLRDITNADSVESIGIQAFYACSNLTSVDVGEKVESIGGEAFAYCYGLENITIPDRVDSIGVGAFAFCKNLTVIEIPSRVESISQELFYGCSSLTQADILGNVTSIGIKAFAFCDSLIEIDIPNGLTEIKNGVFGGCSSLESITIPNGVTSIGERAFGECASLASIFIPASVTSIGEYAFYNCTKLESITIPDNVTKIEDYTFHSCGSLRKIEIPDNVLKIGVASFAYCLGLEEIEIPVKVTSIGEGAFRNCENIKNIIIPNSVTTLGKGAFYECAGLESVKIGDGVKSISEALFEDCTKLIKVCGVNKVTSIGKNAFYGCRSLTSIDILKNVTSIGETAFYNCTSLTTIEFSESLSSISHWAFGYCNGLTKVDIPANVKYIGSRAFYKCTELSKIHFCGVAPVVDLETFLGVSQQAIAYVEPDAEGSPPEGFPQVGKLWNGLLVRYNNQVLFRTYESNGTLTENGVKEQLDTAGVGNIYPFEAIFDDSVKAIGDKAFFSYGNLTNIVLPNDVEKIGSLAFSNCIELLSINIPDSVTKIGERAFEGCIGLLSIDIPDSVKYIGNQAFEGCSKLAAINVSPDNTAYSSFNGVLFNSNKTTLIVYPNGKSGYCYAIPDGVTVISMRAFYNCTGLTTIEIPKSVDEIGNDAFYKCIKLSEFRFDGDAPAVGLNVFTGTPNGATACVYPSAKDFGDAEGVTWYELIVKYRDPIVEVPIIENLVAYQYLPISFVLPTGDFCGWNVIGDLPEGLKISSKKDNIRERGEIYGAPKEIGEYEVTVQAIDENDEPLDEMTFTINVQPIMAQTKLTEVNAFQIVQPLGVFDDAEKIYVINVNMSNPKSVDIVFAYDNEDFIALWIDGDLILQEDSDESGGATSKIITVYGEILEKYANQDPSKTHVLAGEFKDGSQQYVIAQNFKINVIEAPTSTHTPTPTPTTSLDDLPTLILEETENIDNQVEHIEPDDRGVLSEYGNMNANDIDDRVDHENNDDAEDTGIPNQRGGNLGNINMSIYSTSLTDVQDDSNISPTPTPAPTPSSTPTPSPTPTASPTPTQQIGGFSTKGAQVNETVFPEIEPYNSPTDNNNNNKNLIIVFGATTVCFIAFTCAVALRRRQSKKKA